MPYDWLNPRYWHGQYPPYFIRVSRSLPFIPFRRRRCVPVKRHQPRREQVEIRTPAQGQLMAFLAQRDGRGVRTTTREERQQQWVDQLPMLKAVAERIMQTVFDVPYTVIEEESTC